MSSPSKYAQRILDTAIELAEMQSWEVIRLHDIADAMECDLNEIRLHYAQKEDLIDAWFDRADQAMLQDAAAADFLGLNNQERLERVILSWLSALATHQKVTRHMILGRLEPGHLHLQIAGLLRVSRTVQWMREAAHRDAAYLSRALEETLLTSIYLATFSRWLMDDSAEFEKTRQFLHQLLNRSSGLLHLLGGHSSSLQVPPQKSAGHHRSAARTRH